MKKFIINILFLFTYTSLLCKDITIVNDSNENWKTTIASEGKYKIKYQIIRKGEYKIFKSLPNNTTTQIVSAQRIAKGTGLSSSNITLRNDNNSAKNLNIHIKQCPANKNTCKSIQNKTEDKSGEIGKNNIFYYLEE